MVVICIMVWGLKRPIESEYQNETLTSNDEADMDKGRIDETSEREYDKEEKSMKRDMSNRRFRELIGENNEIRYEDLITVKYSAEEIQMLRDYFDSYVRTGYNMHSIHIDLRDKYPFECVRETDRVGYVMFQGEDGRLLCVYFNKENLNVIYAGITTKFLTAEDFQGVEPNVTREKDIHKISGELCIDGRFSAVDLEYCIVEEGTFIFYFRRYGYGWTEDMIANPPLAMCKFFSDGEEPLEGCEQVPQMLPIDKHITEISERKNHK